MASVANDRICVILGAGASYDVRNAGSPVINDGLRPPLARDLFNLEQRSDFRSILAEYEGAVVLAQDLAPRSTQAGFDLEKELRRVADHPHDQMREHYKHVPPYLRDLLMICSYEYTSYPSCYVQLVQALLVEEPSDVLFLVLNYDDLLEQALYRFKNWQIHFESLDDYVCTGQPAKVVKLHGSINWFEPIGNLSADWFTHVRHTDVLAKSADNEIHVASTRGKSDRARTYQVEIAGQRGYPILTAPLAGKGATATVCPKIHLSTAREFLSDCSRFLIIGSSGLDDDLLDLLDESVKKRSPWVQVVSGSAAQGEEVLRRFARKVSAFGSFKSHAGELYFDGGFEAYMASDWPIRFLRV